MRLGAGDRWVLALLAPALLVLAGCMPSGPAPDPGTPTPQGRVQRRAPSTAAEVVVEGGADPDMGEAYQRLGQEALRQVEALWGPESVGRPVRILLPADGAEFAAYTGHDPDEQGVPAVTVGRGEQAVVVVHPDAWHRLTPQGRQAVVTHEVTHLAMQGDGPVPAWLGEGLAEYTAHRGSATPMQVIAGSALEPVRRGTRPDGWPDPVAGAVAGDDRWGGYALSWLACAFLAQEYSEEGLLTLYRRVASGAPLSVAVPEVLVDPEPEVLRAWSRWLGELASRPSGESHPLAAQRGAAWPQSRWPPAA